MNKYSVFLVEYGELTYVEGETHLRLSLRSLKRKLYRENPKCFVLVLARRFMVERDKILRL